MKISNKQIRCIVALFSAFLLYDITNMSYHTSAAELPQNEPDTRLVDVNIAHIREDLTEGMLDIPESVQRQIILYEWIMDGAEQYMTETGMEDTFFCDLKDDVLYDDRVFIVREQSTEWKYAYPIKNEAGIDMKLESYKMTMQGTEHVLDVYVNVKDGKVYIYSGEFCPVLHVYAQGQNEAANKFIERDDDGLIIYYPDFYVESDWDDLAWEDQHFAEVSLDELKTLNYLKIPDNTCDWGIYLNVASVLKRYIEDNQIEDVFYFDADRDVICYVLNMIYTCRVRGESMTLYMDIDSYNMKAHVYQMED